MTVGQNPIIGTDQNTDIFWTTVGAMVRLTMRRDAKKNGRPLGGLPDRADSAIKCEFKEHISKKCQTIGECWLRMTRTHRTGNPSDEDLIEAEKAEFEGTNGYKAMHGCREHVPGLSYLDQAETWVNPWRVLRRVDKYSGAAGVAASGGRAVADNCGDNAYVIPGDDEEGVVSPAKSPRRFQSRPVGSKRAKAVQTTEVVLLRQGQATVDAMDRMANIHQDKADQAFCTGPDMRHTPEAETRRLL